MNLAEKQVELTAQLAALKNGQDRLAFLIEQAKDGCRWPRNCSWRQT